MHLRIILPCKARLSIICPENVKITPDEEAGFGRHAEAVLRKYFSYADADIIFLHNLSGCTGMVLRLEYTADVRVKCGDDSMEDDIDFNNADFDAIEDEDGTLPDKILDEILDYSPLAEKSEDKFEYDEMDFKAQDSLQNRFRETLLDLETDAEEMGMY